MPNSPAKDTVAISFTLPRQLLEAVAAKARVKMTNKSDIVRQALMNYLSDEERVAVLREIASSDSGIYPELRDDGLIMQEAKPKKLTPKEAKDQIVKELGKRVKKGRS